MCAGARAAAGVRLYLNGCWQRIDRKWLQHVLFLMVTIVTVPKVMRVLLFSDGIVAVRGTERRRRAAGT
jgi:hypothetical protein